MPAITHTRDDTVRMSTRQLIIGRVRAILLLCLLCGIAFAGLELWFLPHALPAPFYVKMIGITLIIATYLALRRPWAVRHAWSVSIFVVAMAYVLTALSGIVSPSREYETSAVLFAAAAVTTAVMVPWGLWPQCITTVIGVLSFAAAVFRHDGTLGIFADDPGAAVLIAFSISLVTAREVNRYRLAHRRELQERRRAERAVRRLNQALEGRVRDRTAELEAANRRLACEVEERQKTAEALRCHQDELAHVLRVHTIGEMAAALTHEIHQPLGAITNYARGGVRRLHANEVDPAALQWAFEQIAQEGFRAGEILRGIRELVQRDRPPAVVVDVNAVAADAVRVVEPQARLYGVTLRQEASHQLLAVHGNATQIEQVILNLLLNGIESIPDGGTTSREVTVATTVDDERIEVAVRDSGVGLAPTGAERLFTPFFTTKPRGLGLGLAISRSIIETHGGRIWATANSNSGTTFRFSLPAVASAAAAGHALRAGGLENGGESDRDRLATRADDLAHFAFQPYKKN